VTALELCLNFDLTAITMHRYITKCALQ